MCCCYDGWPARRECTFNSMGPAMASRTAHTDSCTSEGTWRDFNSSISWIVSSSWTDCELTGRCWEWGPGLLPDPTCLLPGSAARTERRILPAYAKLMAPIRLMGLHACRTRTASRIRLRFALVTKLGIEGSVSAVSSRLTLHSASQHSSIADLSNNARSKRLLTRSGSSRSRPIGHTSSEILLSLENLQYPQFPLKWYR